MKNLRLARFLAWLIRFLMYIENIPLWPKRKKPPYPPLFSFENIQFSFWGRWITGENLPEDIDDEAVDALLDSKEFAIFTRADLEARYPGLLSSGETPGVCGTSVSVSPEGYIYFNAFHKYDGSEVSASAHIAEILARKATALRPPADQSSHRHNPGYCAKCGGDCLYDDQGNLAKPLGSNELRCLDCSVIWVPADFTSPACPECGSQNYEG